MDAWFGNECDPVEREKRSAILRFLNSPLNYSPSWITQYIEYVEYVERFGVDTLFFTLCTSVGHFG